MAIYVDNAIFWAQLRIRGGWRNLLTIACSYAAIAIFSITLFHEIADPISVKRYVLYIASLMIVVVQTVMMLLLCGASIAGAIRRDIAGRQIESNRLMPLASSQAITGYMAGSSVHVLALCLVNLLIGAVLAHLRGLPVADWLMVNALLFLFSVCIWTALAMAAFVSRGMFGLLFGVCASVTFSGGLCFLLVPGLLTICTPMHGRTIFEATSISRLTTGTIVAVAAQLLLMILCIRAAARKYSDADAHGITLGPALAMLGIWAGLTWLGMSDFVQMRPNHLAGVPLDWRVLVIGAVSSCLIAALLPIATIAWASIAREQHRAAGDRAPARPWVFWLFLPVCVLFVIVPLSAKLTESVVFPASYSSHVNAILEKTDRPVLDYGRRPSVPMIACACAIFLIQAYFLMRLLYPRLKRANVLIFIFIMVTWFAPLAGDMIYYGLKDPNHNPRMDHFALLSPLGTMVQALDKPVDKSWPGVAAQGYIALLLAMIFLIVQLRGRRALARPVSFAAPAPISSSIPPPEFIAVDSPSQPTA
jgi:hypothetical protein